MKFPNWHKRPIASGLSRLKFLNLFLINTFINSRVLVHIRVNSNKLKVLTKVTHLSSCYILSITGPVVLCSPCLPWKAPRPWSLCSTASVGKKLCHIKGHLGNLLLYLPLVTLVTTTCNIKFTCIKGLRHQNLSQNCLVSYRRQHGCWNAENKEW